MQLKEVTALDTEDAEPCRKIAKGLTLPRQVATRDCATVEKQPKMAMPKSMICFTMVCAASDTGPRAAHAPASSTQLYVSIPG